MVVGTDAAVTCPSSLLPFYHYVTDVFGVHGLPTTSLQVVPSPFLPNSRIPHYAAFALFVPRWHATELFKKMHGRTAWAQGDLEAVQTIVESGLDVFAHNIETVERLQVRMGAVLAAQVSALLQLLLL